MKRKLYIILLIMILIMSSLVIDVSALSFTTSMIPSATKIKDAAELTVTVKVSNLDVGTNGINSLSADLVYDEEVFETLNESSIEGLNGWIPTFTPGTGKIVVKKASFVNSDEELFQITLKTKSGVSENTKGTISLSKIVASNSETEISATNISTTITIGSQSTVINTPGTNNTVTGNTIQITPNITSNTNTSNEAQTNNTVNNVSDYDYINNSNVSNISNSTSQDMPYTGSDGSSIVKILIGVVIVALLAYIKIEKMQDIR